MNLKEMKTVSPVLTSSQTEQPLSAPVFVNVA